MTAGVITTANPADGSMLRLLSEMADEIRALKARVIQLEGTRGTSVELARVSAFIGGSSTCTIRYPDYAAGEVPSSGTLTGPTRTVGFQFGTSPIVGSNALILNSPAWSGHIMPISAF